MCMAKLENLRIRVSPGINSRLSEVSERKRIKKQDIIEGVLSWFLDQDSRLQSLVVGQIEPEFHAEIIDKVLFSLRSAVPPAATAGQPNRVEVTRLGSNPRELPPAVIPELGETGKKPSPPKRQR